MTLTEAQDRMVGAIVALAPKPFERIVADIEILEEDRGYAMDTVCFAIVRGAGGDFEDPSIQLDRDVRQTVIDLYKAVRATREDAVPGSIGLTIEGDGRYKLDYDYGTPRRLNGEWDEEKEGRLDTYLTTFREEVAAR